MFKNTLQEKFDWFKAIKRNPVKINFCQKTY